MTDPRPTTLPKRRIFFFETHPLMVLGIKALIDRDEALELCGSSGNHRTLMDELGETDPDALLLDLSLYTDESLTFLERIRERLPGLAIVLLSVHTQPALVAKARAAGADSYVLKTEDPTLVLDAIHATLAGHTYVSPRVRRTDIDNAPHSDSPINLLSTRQFRILQRIGKGRTQNNIAAELVLPIRTVEAELVNIQEKLGLSSPVELLQFASHWVHHEGGFR